MGEEIRGSSSRTTQMPIVDLPTHWEATLAFPVAESAEEASTRREGILASEMVAPASLPGATLDYPASAEVPDTPLEALTSIPSPASLLAVLVSPEAAVETLAIHLDPSAGLAAAISSHLATRTLASALEATGMEGSSVRAAVTVEHAITTEM